MICEHNEKLASGDEKKNEKFVTLNFLFFGAESLGESYKYFII
jgi:hypothetical protein